MTAAGKHPVPNEKPSIRWGRGQEREVGLGIEFRRGATLFFREIICIRFFRARIPFCFIKLQWGFIRHKSVTHKT